MILMCFFVVTQRHGWCLIIFAQLDLTDMVVLPNKKHDGRYFGVLPTKNVGDLSWQKSLDLAKKRRERPE